jgi:hypothetical protein
LIQTAPLSVVRCANFVAHVGALLPLVPAV